MIYNKIEWVGGERGLFVATLGGRRRNGKG